MTNDEKLKNNNYFIDNLKVILIFLVVFGHLIERYIDTNSTLLGVYMFIHTFHMPLFIFVILYISSIILSLFICEITPKKKTFYSNIGKSTMYVYTFHIYIILLIFYFIPKWNISYITNWIILLSPILITYILSRKYIANSYNFIFNKITKLIIR